MTAKTLGYIAIGAGALLAIGYAYTKFSWNKETAVDDLIKGNFTTQPKSALMTWGDGFLKAWIKAGKAGVGTFVFEGKKYSTQGGKAIK